MYFRMILIAASVSFSSAAAAQSISVEDLQKQIDAELTKGSEYISLLNQPDTKRALAAMKVMMASGDPELVQIAADYGLYSANPAVRAEALRGYFATNPRVDFFLSRKGSKGDFNKAMEELFQAEANADGTVATAVTIGEYQPENDCYLNQRKDCWLQIRPEAIRFKLHRVWNELSFTDDASLVGSVNAGWGATEVPLRIQLR